MSNGFRRRLAFAGLRFAILALALRPNVACWAGPKWDPIPPEQLAQAGSVVEPGADAEILLWTVTVTDELQRTGMVSVRDYFVRVKVFTQQGAQDWTQHDLDYPTQDVRITDVKARTILPDGTVVEMSDGSVSRETVVKSSKGSVKRTSFALPRVEPGCILEYRYTERRLDLRAYADHYPLQFEAPAQKVVFRIRPAGLVNLRQLTFHTAASPSRVPVNGYFETSALRQRAIQQEPDMPPYWQLAGFMFCYYTLSDAQSSETFWTDHGRVVDDWFQPATKPDADLRKAAAELVQGAASDRERVQRVAEWLRTHFRIVRSGGADSLSAAGLREVADARAAFRQRGGYPRDALMVFAAMLRAVDIDSRWVKVPSRSAIFFDRNMMAEGLLNASQLAVRTDGHWVTLDPFTPYLPWDMQAWDEEATTALLCDRDSSRFVETSWSQPERTQRGRRAELELRPDGTLEGELRVRYSGHLNDHMRRTFEEAEAADRDSVVTRALGFDASVVQVSRLQISNPDASAEPLELTAHVVLPAFAAVTGKRILLEPAVLYAHERPRFTSSTRRHPVYFRHPWNELDTVVVRVAEGWSFESTESVQPLQAPGVAGYEATVMVSDDRRTLRYVRKFQMGVDGSIYFPRNAYAEVKSLFEEVHARDGVAVVLARTEASP